MHTLPYPAQPHSTGRTGPLRHLLQLARKAWPRPAARPAMRPLPPVHGIDPDQPPPAAPHTRERSTASVRAVTVPRTLPLRVVRVLDTESTGAPSGGRMRISGRMADVCAELDRLAEREAALQRMMPLAA